ncbi:hypothetical protein A2394_02440 [Candidatus Woesebacteria bacterium RIFOXYB1_FULL_42_36]|nr:MAG: hypothetical protein A2208_02130 [Candidatus Woesebacteria bacterium RIFOXYA1_FULL_43_16]OGM82189.1 MAG: hypothetical protein A2394_02440 [Candidatus Woesebacteria bacterium RIFOXYB1_FULL_42_36]
MVIFVFVGIGSVQVKAAEGHQVFLPLIMKPYPEPQCNIVVTTYAPNFVTFDISCQNAPDGWAHIQFDTLGQDGASTDIEMINGVAFTDHYYPWPFTSFTARLTVTGLNGGGYDFDIPVYVYWP